LNNPADHLSEIVGDPPAAAATHALHDRRELALVAVERTRMPMVVTNPRHPDNPIVLANKAFLYLSGYSADEVIGRNCRFLQGPDTAPESVAAIREALASEHEITIEMLNYRKDGSGFWNELCLSPVRDEAGCLNYYFGSQLDVTARREARELQAAETRLLRELDHRALNVLAVVQGIVRQTPADDPKRYARTVQARVQALARAHAALAEGGWTHAPLSRLIYLEVEPYGAQNVSIQGPAVRVPASLVQPIGLLIHELISNTAAHGALSRPGGGVSVYWADDPEAASVQLHWVEHGGPVPRLGQAGGFGSRIIEGIVKRQLGGNLHLNWPESGLQADLSIPRSKLDRPLGSASGSGDGAHIPTRGTDRSHMS